MENYDFYMNSIVILTAVYCFYVWFTQTIKGRLVRKNFFLSSRANELNCSNLNGYIKESSSKIMLLGLISFSFAGFDIFACETGLVPPAIQYIVIGAYVILLFYYSRIFRQFNTKYWPSI
jgi:hypothetical protein